MAVLPERCANVIGLGNKHGHCFVDPQGLNFTPGQPKNKTEHDED